MRIVIIGAGVIGCAVARELRRYNADVTVLEKENDVACGTSKANSGVVHAGFDAVPGTLKARYNVLGNAAFDRLSAELGFSFKRNGAYVLCFSKEDEPVLGKLLEQGIENGVKQLEIHTGEQIRKKEKYVSEEVTAGLWAPSSGIVSPYGMTIAYAENAAVNGAEFKTGKRVDDIFYDGKKIVAGCSDGSVYPADLIVNCAGVHGDDVNNILCEDKLKITARKGEYMLLDKTAGGYAHSTLFQLPTKMGKGILVVPTVSGNIMLGPTAADVDDKDCADTTFEGLEEAFSKARRTVPSLDKRAVITQFTGLRAHSETGDFEIGFATCRQMYNIVGIESPGLTAAPAIATSAAEEIAAAFGLERNENFVAQRKAPPSFAKMTDEQRAELIAKDPLYGKIVCRCENVTEGEIVDAIRRPVGAKDLDGIKRRTRAGMGRCQGGFCTPRVMEILARELGCDVAEVTKNGKGSEIVVGRIE